MSEKGFDTEHYEELLLTKLKARVTGFMSGDIIRSASIDAFEMLENDMYEGIVNLIIPAKEVVEKPDFRYVPATWWDHFKMERGWRYKKEEIRVGTTKYYQCPHISPGSSRTEHLTWLRYAGEPERLRHDLVSRCDE